MVVVEVGWGWPGARGRGSSCGAHPTSRPGHLTHRPPGASPAPSAGHHVSGAPSLLRLAQGAPSAPGRVGQSGKDAGLGGPRVPPCAGVNSIPGIWVGAAPSLVIRDDLTSGVSWGRDLEGVTRGLGFMSRPLSQWSVLFKQEGKAGAGLACSGHVGADFSAYLLLPLHLLCFLPAHVGSTQTSSVVCLNNHSKKTILVTDTKGI